MQCDGTVHFIVDCGERLDKNLVKKINFGLFS